MRAIVLPLLCGLLLALTHVRAATVSVIADGFGWVENLAFDGRGNAFVSDLVHGSITRITFDAATKGYVKHAHLDGFSKVLGLTVDETVSPPILYAVVGVDKQGLHKLIATDTTVPNAFKTVVTDLGTTGNGLGRHAKTGLLYTSSEGNFLPGGGTVFVVDPVTGNSTVLKSDLWAADGLWIDQVKHILYVGQLFSANLWAYDLAAGKEIGILAGLPSGLLDDFCLSNITTGDAIIGCDWSAGSLYNIPLNTNGGAGGAPTVLVQGLGHVTSVRWGTGPGFAGSLFATEGDGLFSWQHADRVYKIDL